MTASTPEKGLQRGTFVGTYELVAPLGRGGFGEVWRATAHPSGAAVAVKLLTEFDADTVRRFEVEFRALVRINHPGCSRPIDHGVTETGRPFLVTEFIDGVTLSAWLRKKPDFDDVLAVLRQIAAVLTAAHREGIVHRDLKPANVLVCDVDGSPSVKVLDFGIAKLVGPRQGDITKTGEVIGTPGYMSPEQLLGQRDIGSPTDIYALGVIAFELLEGRPPFAGDSPLAVGMRHLTEPPPKVRADAPAPLPGLVAKMLEKQADRRPTALAVEQALGSTARPSLPEVPRPRGRRIGAWHLLAGALLAVALVAAVYAGGGPDEAKRPGPSAHPRAPNPILAATQTPNHEAPADTAERRPPECRDLRRLPEGPRRLGVFQDGVLVRVPRGYSPTRKYPVIVFFHEMFQPPELAIDNVDFDTPGADDYVWIFPLGNPHAMESHWVAGGVLARALEDIDSVPREVCVDLDELFVVGHGNGGRAVDHLGCAGRTPIAAATFGHRRFINTVDCTNGTGTPTFSVFPLNDKTAPFSGQLGCTSANFIPAEQQIDELKRENGCTSEVQLDRQCMQGRCEQALEYCRISGGRILEVRTNALGSLAVATKGCELGTPTQFPFVARALEFFGRIRATRGND